MTVSVLIENFHQTYLDLVMSQKLDCLPLDGLLEVNKGLQILLRLYAPGPVHGVLRLTNPNSFFDWSESLINLPVNYF